MFSSLGTHRVRPLPLDRIALPSRLWRRKADGAEMAALADSIKRIGLLTPILVRPKGGEYELVAGYRRYLCAKRLGWKRIPAVVRALSDAEAVEATLAENAYRLDFSAAEKAEAFRDVTAAGARLKPDELAKLLGERPEFSAEVDSILRFPLLLREALIQRIVTLEEARVLAPLDDDRRIAEAIRAARDAGAGTLGLRAIVAQMQGQAVPLVEEPASPPPVRAVPRRPAPSAPPKPEEVVWTAVPEPPPPVAAAPPPPEPEPIAVTVAPAPEADVAEPIESAATVPASEPAAPVVEASAPDAPVMEDSVPAPAAEVPPPAASPAPVSEDERAALAAVLSAEEPPAPPAPSPAAAPPPSSAPAASAADAEEAEDAAKPEALLAHPDLIRAVRSLFRRLGKEGVLDIELLKAAIARLMKDLSQLNPVDFLDLTYRESPRRYLPRHALNVAKLTLYAGKHYGFTEDDLIVLGTAALLCDVGMLRVEEGILYKADRLDAKEWQRVRGHALEGAVLLGRPKALWDTVARVAAEHHERMNGSGYPRGLKSADLHTYSKLVAIADTYEALTAQRLHKPPILPWEAMERIQHEAETGLFDRPLAGAFLRYLGAYPIGSFVQLAPGELAQVIWANATEPAKPVVRVVVDRQGRAQDTPPIVDLTKDPTAFPIKAVWPPKIG